MTCVEAQPLLHAYLDGELDFSTSFGIEQHLETCMGCSGKYRKLEMLRAEIAHFQGRHDEAAELVTCQNTLHDCAPRVRLTRLSVAVTRSDPTWKMNTEVGSFCPSRVTVPVRAMVAGDLYTPETRVWPPRLALTVLVVAAPAAKS